MTKQSIVIVPAKANSSRVPRKNFRPFHKGKSLVDITLDTLVEANLDCPLILSTDNTDYRYPHNSVSIFPRSSSLSKFETPILDVLKQILQSFNSNDILNVILVQPTSPFRTTSDFRSFFSFSRGLHLKDETISASTTIFSTYRVEDAHPARMYFTDNSSLIPVLSQQADLQCQDLSDCFHRNGCFYSFSPDSLNSNRLYSSSLRNYNMPYISSLNIDTPTDFNLAQLAYPSFLTNEISLLPSLD